MKTIKAISLLSLASLFLVNGLAFAGSNAYNQLKDGPSFDGAAKQSGDTPTIKAAAAPAASAAVAAKPAEPKPTLKERLTKWTGENKTKIFMAGIGAYIGFALVGTLLGACTFGIGALLILAIAAA